MGRTVDVLDNETKSKIKYQISKMTDQRLKKVKVFLILLSIFITGSFLRLWKIDKYPVGFTPDEAAQGYTAYSILTTGRDEWGVKFPLNPRSFGDFKPPLQTYLIVPSVAVLGLNEFAVRLPNALLGSLAILGTFLLAKELFGLSVGMLSAGMLAFSPWNIQLSRGAFEANLTVFFISFGIYFLLKAFKSRKVIWQILAALFLGLNMFSYHSPKLLTPVITLLFIIYCLLFIKEEKRKGNFKTYFRKYFIFYILYFIFFLVAFSSFFAGGQRRGLDIAIFHPTDNWLAVKDERYFAVKNGLPDTMARLFHNKLTYSLSLFFRNYFSYFSPQFLFSEGPAEGSYGMNPSRGVLWWWELPILVFGLACFFKKPTKKAGLVLLLILLSPVPAALTKGERMANRAAGMMPFIQMLTAVSIWKLKVKSEKLKIRNIRISSMFLYLYVFVFLLFFVFFLEDYFIQSPRKVTKQMLYGRCEAIRKIVNYEDKAETIIVSRKLSEPQAYIAFCLKFAPNLVQYESRQWLDYEKRNLSFLDQLGEYKLRKYIFRELNWVSDSKLENAILIGGPDEFPKGADNKFTVFYPKSENPAVMIYFTNKNILF